MVALVDGFFDESGLVQAYLFRESTGEYCDAREIQVYLGCGLPAGATMDAPPEVEEGKVAVWQDDAWKVVPDYRGLVYRTSDGAEIAHQLLGELPEGLTTLPRPGPAYVWGSGAWVLDEGLDLEVKAAAEQRWLRNELNVAGEEIAKHEDGDPQAFGDVGAWRAYRVELRAWPQHPSFPDATKRPISPSTE